MEESHGLWKRRIVVVIGYPTANHYLACSLYAPLTTAFWRIREVAERQPPFLLPRRCCEVQPGYILRRAGPFHGGSDGAGIHRSWQRLSLAVVTLEYAMPCTI